MKKFLAAFIFTFLFSSMSFASVNETLNSMTLEQKIGQLFIIRPDALDTNLTPEEINNDKLNAKGVEEINKTMLETLKKYPAGGFILFRKNIKTPKQLNKMISDELIGKDEELHKLNPLFQKVNYIIKNLPINEYGYPIERMSFRNLVLSEFKDNWEDSSWKNYFEEVTLVVICYRGEKGSKNGERVLEGVKQITFNDKDIELFGRTYNQVKRAIEQHDISLLPQPKRFEGQILEVAPKGQKGDDAYKNFFKKDVTKVCFMLDKDFLFSKLTSEKGE